MYITKSISASLMVLGCAVAASSLYAAEAAESEDETVENKEHSAEDKELDWLSDTEVAEPESAPVESKEPAAAESQPATPTESAGPVLDTIPVKEPPPAAAEPDRAPARKANATIEEIVVTAQKRAEDIQSVPIAMTALSASDIQDRHVSGMDDLAGQVPSLQYAQFSGVGVLSIRGIGFGFVSGGGENAIAVHNDGVFVSAPGAVPMLQEDIASMEVLRGPQGTLYGRNATGGVINFISTSPEDHFAVGASALVGSYSRKKFFAHVGGPVTDALRARVSYSSDDRGGHVENENLDRQEGGVFNRTGRLSVDYDLLDDLDLQFRAYSSQETFQGPVNQLVESDTQRPYPPRETYDPRPWHVKTDSPFDSEKSLHGGSLRVNYNINDVLSLSSISGYSRFKTDMSWDGDATTMPLFVGAVTNDKTGLSQEFNLNGDSDPWKWILGLFYYQDRNALSNIVYIGQINEHSVIPIPLPPGTIGSRVDYPSREKVRSAAVFGDLTYSLTDAARLYGGLRYTKDRKQFHQTVSTVAADGVAQYSCRDLDLSMDKSAVTGRLGGQYDLAEETMAFAQLSTGYKGGGFAIDACDDPYRPERLAAAELGVKSMLLDGRLRLNGSLYGYRYTDLQYEEVVVPVVNVHNADARIYGAELEATVVPLEGLQLDSQLALARAYYVDLMSSDTLNPDPTQDTDQSGNPVMRTPKWQASLGLQYEFGVPGNHGALTLRGEGMWSAGYQTRVYDDPLDEQPRYETYNGYLTYVTDSERANGGLSVRLFGKNLTNVPVIGVTIDSGNYRTASFGLPRTYGFELAYEFR